MSTERSAHVTVIVIVTHTTAANTLAYTHTHTQPTHTYGQGICKFDTLKCLKIKHIIADRRIN